MQTKVLNDITNAVITTNPALEAIKIQNFSNTGKLSIQFKESVGEIASVNYDFQRDTMKFSITINEKKIPSQPLRPNYFDFYMKHTEISCYEGFKNKLIRELSEAFPVKKKRTRKKPVNNV